MYSEGKWIHLFVTSLLVFSATFAQDLPPQPTAGTPVGTLTTTCQSSGPPIRDFPGTIRTPNFPDLYEPGLVCVYDLLAPNPNSRIQIQFEYFDLENSTNCQKDQFTILDNDQSGSIVLAYCGPDRPPSYVTQGAYVRILFATDTVNERYGFSVTYDTQAAPETTPVTDTTIPTETTVPFTGTTVPVVPPTATVVPGPVFQVCDPGQEIASGTVTSPAYPAPYQSEVTCGFSMQAPGQDDVIELVFDFFDLEDSTGCGKDAVIVIDPQNAASSQQRYCGRNGPTVIRSLGRILTVALVTDPDTEGTGFTAHFTAIPAPSTTSVASTTPVTSQTTPVAPVTTSPAVLTVIRECESAGIIVRNFPVNIRTPTFPALYQPGLVCVYDLLASNPDSRIQLQFDFFDLEESADCGKDQLLLLDTGGGGAARTTVYCGSELPPTYISDGSILRVVFVTDSETQRNGFSVNFDAVDPPTVPTTPTTAVTTEANTEATTTPATPVPTTTPAPDSTLPATAQTVPTGTPTGTLIIECQQTGLIVQDFPGTIWTPAFPDPYEPGLVCVYDILSQNTEERIRIQFEYFDLENSVDCSKDRLLLLDNSGTGAATILTLCGSSLPTSYTSEGSYIRLIFLSDSDVQRNGFSLSYDAILPGTTAITDTSPTTPVTSESSSVTPTTQPTTAAPTTPSVTSQESTVPSTTPSTAVTTVPVTGGQGTVIKSCDNSGVVIRDFPGVVQPPNFPDPYQAGLVCVYDLLAPNTDSRIQLQFSFFDLEDSADCTKDQFVILDNAGQGEAVVLRYCGGDEPPPYLSEGSFLRVVFITDTENQANGFSLNYDFVPTPSSTTDSTTPSTTESTTPSTTPSTTSAPPATVTTTSGTPASTVGPQGTVFDTCAISGVLLQSYPGTIRPPSFPQPYQPELVCVYDILAPNTESRIQLVFDYFDLEDSAECQKDRFLILDSAGGGDTNVLTFCGSTRPQPYVSAGPVLKLVFLTDVDTEASGFSVNFDIIASVTTTTPGVTVTTNPNDTPTTVLPPLETAVPGPVYDVCDGVRQISSGTVRSTLYPDRYPAGVTCAFSIQAPGPNDVIEVVFDFFRLEDSPDCRKDSLIIIDPANSATPQRYCGDRLPPTFRSLGAALTLALVTDADTQDLGFSAHFTAIPASTTVATTTTSATSALTTTSTITATRTTTQQTCGGVLTATQGLITSPGFPNDYRSVTECTWVLSLPQGYNMQLNFQVFDVACPGDNVIVSTGLNIVLDRTCGNTVPPAVIYTRSERQVSLTFSSDAQNEAGGFAMSYVIYTDAETTVAPCGGTYTDASGTFSSPGYPGNYGNNLNCRWHLEAPPGSAIELQFLGLDLQTDPGCTSDFVIILNESGTLGVYCEEIPPVIVPDGQQLDVYLYTDDALTASGFQARYKIVPVGVCGGTHIGPSGEISSPGYPRDYPMGSDCLWTINVAEGEGIRLQFETFDVEIGSVNCLFDYLLVSTGDSTQPQYKLCGDARPDVIQTTTNTMTLQFVSDNQPSTGFRGFKASYEGVDITTAECGGLHVGTSGEITSPGYGVADSYGVNLNCTWVIQTNPGTAVRVRFINLDTESQTPNCRYDYVLGINTDGSLMGRYCADNWPSQIVSMGNELRLQFITDYLNGGLGFRLTWDTTIPPPTTIPPATTTTTTIPTSTTTTARVTTSSATTTMTSPTTTTATTTPIPTTTATTTTTTPPTVTPPPTTTVITTTPLPTTTTTPTAPTPTTSPVTATGPPTERLCGGVIRNDGVTITSPDFPLDYPHGVTCIWEIIAPVNQVVNLIVDSFSLEADIGDVDCRYDYVAFIDSNMDVVGRYCGINRPDTIISLYNTITVLFDSNHVVSAPGFSMRVNFIPAITRTDVDPVECGGSAQAPVGRISSPGYPQGYPSSSLCYWAIETDPGTRVAIDFDDVTFGLVCPFDKVTVFDSDGTKLGSYCEDNKPSDVILASSNKAYVFFESDVTEAGPGFDMVYQAVTVFTGTEGTTTVATTTTTPTTTTPTTTTTTSTTPTTTPTTTTPPPIPQCGGNLQGPTGAFTSPNYPAPYQPNIQCVWRVVTSPATRVKVSFKEFELPEESTLGSCVDYITIIDPSFPETRRDVCGSELPADFVSISNDIAVILISGTGNPTGGYKGFSALYEEITQVETTTTTSTTMDPTGTTPYSVCGGDVSGPEGVIVSPNYPASYDQNQQCVYGITTAEGTRVRVTFTDFDLAPGPGDVNCYDYLTLLDTVDGSFQQVATYCGSALPTEYTSTGNGLVVVFLTTTGREMNGLADFRGFRLQYQEVADGDTTAPTTTTPAPTPASTTQPTTTPTTTTTAAATPPSTIPSTPLPTTPATTPSTTPSTPSKTPSTAPTTTPATTTVDPTMVPFTSECLGPTLDGSRGAFSSPNYPGRWRDSSGSCNWFIQLDDPSAKVMLTFTDFELAPGTEQCVDVYDYNNQEDFFVFRGSPASGYCGTYAPPTLISSSNQVLIYLRGIREDLPRGFYGTYEAIYVQDTTSGMETTPSTAMTSPEATPPPSATTPETTPPPMTSQGTTVQTTISYSITPSPNTYPTTTAVTPPTTTATDLLFITPLVGLLGSVLAVVGVVAAVAAALYLTKKPAAAKVSKPAQAPPGQRPLPPQANYQTQFDFQTAKAYNTGLPFGGPSNNFVV